MGSGGRGENGGAPPAMNERKTVFSPYTPVFLESAPRAAYHPLRMKETPHSPSSPTPYSLLPTPYLIIKA
ncbi:MAG: hypothetical protein DSM106950_32615 [Stigonema ocellatum SAG 48.90 = DSM 106950]|nr:hypothetical protein [Stigonema ocellatum SAG 48.90 = DSM 106950]